MNRQVKGVDKENSNQPCWLEEANNRNVRWKRTESDKKRSQNGIKLPSSESQYLWRK